MNYEEKKAEITRKAQEELQKLEREAAVRSTLPVDPENVFFSGSLGVWVDYTVENPVAAAEFAGKLISQFGILTYYIPTDHGIVSVRPEGLTKKADFDRMINGGRYQDFHAPFIALEKGSWDLGTTQATVCFWAKVDADIIKFRIKVNNHPWAIATTYSNPRNPRNSASVDHKAPWKLGAAYRRIKWATGDKSSASFGFYCYSVEEFEALMGVEPE